MPFSVDKMSVRDCQYGDYYWKEKKETENKNKLLKLQGSCKIGCHVHMHTDTHTFYTLYPDFQLASYYNNIAFCGAIALFMSMLTVTVKGNLYCV